MYFYVIYDKLFQNEWRHDISVLGKNPRNLTNDYFLDHRVEEEYDNAAVHFLPCPNLFNLRKSEPCRVKIIVCIRSGLAVLV